MSNDRLSITVANALSEIPRVAERIERFCRDRSISPRIARRFTLALEEALTNAISHGFPHGGRHEIDVHITHEPGVLHATVSDDGVAFDPLSHAPPDIHAPVHERRIGGLGIHLLRELADAVDYRRIEGRNVLAFRLPT